MTGNEVVSAKEVGSQIDTIVKDCMPIATQEAAGFNDALILAQGVGSLREIFEKNEMIKKTVMSMKDTELGFLTDRNPQSLEYANRNGKTIEPYTYEELIEPCIVAMLHGYRLTNNEFNVIAGKFYAAKNGKYRKIIETDGVTDFKFTTTTPLYETESRTEYGKQKSVQFAKVQCFASWKKDGAYQSIGESKGGVEDKLVFKIKVNNAMGDDAIVGKALSKLFSRVLMRLSGKSTENINDVDPDVQDADIVKPENTPETSDIETRYHQLKLQDIKGFIAAYQEAGFQSETDIKDETCRAKVLEAYEHMN